MLSEIVNRSRPLPTGSRLLILGGGFSGTTVAKAVEALGTPVITTRRQPCAVTGTLPFDSHRTATQPGLLQGVTHLLSTIPRIATARIQLTQLLPDLKSLPLQWAVTSHHQDLRGSQGALGLGSHQPNPVRTEVVVNWTAKTPG